MPVLAAPVNTEGQLPSFRHVTRVRAGRDLVDFESQLSGMTANQLSTVSLRDASESAPEYSLSSFTSPITLDVPLHTFKRGTRRSVVHTNAVFTHSLRDCVPSVIFTLFLFFFMRFIMILPCQHADASLLRYLGTGFLYHLFAGSFFIYNLSQKYAVTDSTCK